MRLLNKKTVATEQARERKTQIDEGLKLATKIDALRRSDAEVEVQHNKFVSGMKAELESQTIGLSDGIKAKKEELVEIEAERQKLLEPLTAKWEEVTAKEKQVDTLLAQAQQDALLAEKSKDKYSVLEKKMKDSQALTKVREREVTKLYLRTQIGLDEAEQIRMESATEAQKQEASFSLRRVALDNQERTNNFDFVANGNMRAILDEREIELNMREKEINDKYATLERTINRTQK